MVLFNYGNKEITAKIVFYGPGLGGKTTNLQFIHEKMNPETRGKLLSLATEADRTLFFDFLPVNLGMIRGFTVRFQLYTVPGQVYYNATRRLVLKGADAVVFVADSQTEMMEKNIESLDNMKENLIVNGLDPETIPLIIQYNKRDLPNVMEVDELNRRLNERGVPYNAAVAVRGDGVLDTFKLVTKALMLSLRGQHNIKELQEVKQPVSQSPEASEPPSTSMPPVSAEPTGTIHHEPVMPPVPPAFPEAGAAEGNHLAESVQEIRRQIRNVEEQLQTLLEKDDSIQALLQQINEKLEENEKRKPIFSEDVLEEPIILKEKKLKKKGFFWNR
jgi:signal recognition particle receptor subunit beta